MTRKLLAEFIGTAALLLVVVGSGIMGESLAQGNTAVALLANAIATGCGLYVLIHIFGPISGAHFNPIVTLMELSQRAHTLNSSLAYMLTQIVGAISGVWLAHIIFAQPLLQISTHLRDGPAQWTSEAVATAGLLLTIQGFSKHNRAHTATGVALYITGAYWFTSSTSFANPAVTMARGLTNTFAGIAPASIAGFILGQVIGLGLALILGRLLFAPPIQQKIARP